MAKMLLMSILFATIAIPMRYASEPVPAVGFKKMVRAMAIFTALWGLGLAFVYFRLIYG